MPIESARSRKWWVSRALQAGRAAAFLTLATGLNGAIAVYAPRYEPIYVYLVSIAIVAWLGSMLLGLTAAVAAVVLYDWLFSPVRVVPSVSAIVPLSIAVAVAIGTRLVRAPVLQSRVALPRSTQQLLPASSTLGPGPSALGEPAFPEGRGPTAEGRIAEIADLEQKLSEATAAAEEQGRLRAEAAAATRFRVASLQRELDETREQVVQQVNRVAALRGEVDAAKRASDERIALLEQKLDAARHAASEERDRADREAASRTQEAAAANASMQKAMADLAAKYQAPLAAAKKSLEDAFTRIPQLERELTAARGAVAEQAERANRLEATLGEAMTRLTGSEARVAGLLEEVDALRAESAIERSRAERESSLREEAERAAREQISLLETEFDESRKAEAEIAVRAASERAVAEATAEAAAETSRQEIARLQSGLTAAQKTAEDAVARAEIEKAQREREHREFDEKLQRIVNGLTTDHEHAIGEALVQRETARAEARNLATKVQELQLRVVDVDKLQVEVEKKMADMRRQIEDARRTAAEEKAARERLDAEWSAKMQRIISGIATDHEHDVGEALLEKEAAKAEVRSLTGKLHALQQKLNEERQAWNLERTRLVAEQPFPDAVVAPQATAVVLVVHSDAGVRAMSKHALEQAGYAVLTAADGLEGLRVASTQKPAVVLAESVMPKMDGRELVQLLKSRHETSDIKIILLGGANGAEMERGADFRADDFLRNPADFNGMRTTLANVLAKRGSS